MGALGCPPQHAVTYATEARLGWERAIAGNRVIWERSSASMAVPPAGRWLKQKELADLLGVQLNAVRHAVSVLERVGRLRTRLDLADRRYVLVHESSIALIRRALGLPDHA